jgi:hypothetical protein
MRFATRSTLLAVAVALACAATAHAQDAQKTFNAKGASEAQACDAAMQQARDWVKRGKSEGRARELLDDGTCTCTAAAGTQACTLTVRASEVQREEEEER